MRYYYENAADFNAADDIKQSPIFYASREGRIEFLNEFIKLGANPNHKDSIGQTPLFYAARQGHLEVCKLLVENGCTINHKDIYKQTAIVFAKRYKVDHVVEYLQEMGPKQITQKKSEDLTQKKRKTTDTKE